MTSLATKQAIVIGGGLAGCEAAWQLAERGIAVNLYEMRPEKNTPAHHTAHLGELVCSNSLKSMSLPAAAATLKHELAAMGSFVLKTALEHRVEAGMALAVERTAFSEALSIKLEQHPRIKLVRKEIVDLASLLREVEALSVRVVQDDRSSSLDEEELGTQASERRIPVVIATGPLTSDAFAADIARLLGNDYLAFFDAAAPIVEAESLNMQKLVRQSRFDKGEGEYLNALLTKEEYEALVESLVQADRVVLKDFEKRELFSACQPVEEVARSGKDALRYGALKPIGLVDPATGKRPYAAIQLRAENPGQTAWNLVGFQTNLSFKAQEEVFRLIPGLEQASFSRFGVMHRNTFINAPATLGPGFELCEDALAQDALAQDTSSLCKPLSIRFAGQITGTEGYTEAIASGLLAALNTFVELNSESGLSEPVILPQESTFGALVAYATSKETLRYQPMHVNYGLMLPLEKKPKGKKERYQAYSQRALEATKAFISKNKQLAFLPAFELPQFTQGEERS